MAAALPVIAAVSGAAAVVGTIQSGRERRKAARLSQEQQAVATRRSRRQAIRQTQIRRAQAVASAQAGGSLTGSGAAGGIQGISSQLGSELGFSTQMSGLSAQIGRAQSRAALFGDIAQLGSIGFQAAGGFNAFDNQKPTSPAQAQAGNTASSFHPARRPQARPRTSVPPYYQPGTVGPF
jgi:hypothetical protein